MQFTFKQFIVPNFAKRLAFMLPAVLCMGVFLSFLILIGWGTDPASFMNLNIASALGLSLGNTQVIVYALMFVFTFVFGPHFIGFGTLANMILVGYTVDLCNIIWKALSVYDFVLTAPFAVKLPIFCAALLGFVVAAAIYINAEMGVAPYDASPQIIARFLPRVPFVAVRIAFDLSAVAVGVVVGVLSRGGIQGSIVGSVAMSLLLGPVITFVGKKLSRIL